MDICNYPLLHTYSKGLIKRAVNKESKEKKVVAGLFSEIFCNPLSVFIKYRVN
jgi:hypothetical protein